MKKVFISEKYNYSRIIIEGIVEKNSFDCVGWESDGYLAFKKIIKTQPDIVIINYDVYGDYIFEVLKKIFLMSKKLHIIIVLDHRNKLLEKSLMEDGVFAILTKPFSEIQLVDIIKTIA